MLLLGANHLLGGGFADGLCQALASEAVSGRQQSVVYRLSSHVDIHFDELDSLLLTCSSTGDTPK